MEKKRETGIVKVTKDLAQIPLTAETIRAYLCADATDQEITLFLNQCAMFRLNPFKREIYLIKYSKKDPAAIVVGKEAYLKRAERSKKWDGMESGVTYDKAGNIVTGWAKIYRKDWRMPLFHSVLFAEYVEMKDEWINGERTGNRVPRKFWAEKPATMIEKVAVVQAIRTAFPDETGGMPYIEEEIHASKEGPTMQDIAAATGVKVEIVEKTPLKDVEDEFSNPEKYPVGATAQAAPDADVSIDGRITAGGYAIIKKKIDALKSRRDTTINDDLIFNTINDNLDKKGFLKIVELGDLTPDAGEYVSGMLDLWAAHLDKIRIEKEKKNGQKKG